MTVSLIRLSPSERSVCRWLGLVPIADRIWVTLSRVVVDSAISGPLSRTRAQHGGRGDVLQGQAAAGRDLLGTDEVLQRLHGGVHDVDRVRRAEALRQHVVDAGALEDGADRTTGDDTGTGAGRLEQHDTGGRLTLHRVRDGAGDAGHLVEVLLRLLDALGDRRGHLLGLAVADADGAVTVADDDQRGEAEAPATLDDLGHAVDGDDELEERALLGGSASGAPPAVTTVAAVVSAAGAAAASLWSWHQTSLSISVFSRSSLQPAGLRSPAIRSPARPRGHPRRGPRCGRRTGCLRGRRPPRRSPRPSPARPP